MMKHPIAVPLSTVALVGTTLLTGALFAGGAQAAPHAPSALVFPEVGVPAPAATLQAGAARTDEPLYYASIKSDEVAVRNLMDAKGLAVADLDAGDVVAVHAVDENTDWLTVEVPTGYAAYVYGRFLEETDTKGIYRVTRNAVNIRPKPSDDVQSFPLPQRLHAGDQVAVIGASDPNKPMAEDWVRIWTPPGVRAFVRAQHVERLEPTAGQSAWIKAAADIAVTRREILGLETGSAPSVGTADAIVSDVEAGVDDASAEAGESAASLAAVRESLRDLRARVDVEQRRATPDYASLRAEAETLLSATEDATLKAEIARELERVTALDEAASMFQELQRIKDQQDQETARLQNSIWENGRRLDPLRSAFDHHGILVRRIAGDGTPRYTIEVRRKVVAELLCTSGRYDLDAFSGYEIGIRGRGLVVEAAATEESEVDVPVLDVTRIAVLKRR